MASHELAGPFSSIEERIAHLQWRKKCNEREIRGTLQLTKQLQERDEFRRIAKDKSDRIEWVQHVIRDELQKPLPVTPQFLDQLKQQQAELEQSRDGATQRHITQIKQIQSKLEEREAQLYRKQQFEKKKKELFGGD